MEGKTTTKKKKQPWFWTWAIGSIIFRFLVIYFSQNVNLTSRPEVATPVTSLRRLAEAYWLKRSAMSPYAGSMYHGSPLLLSLLGPITVTSVGGRSSYLLCSLLFVIADFLSAMLIRAIGKKLQVAYSQSLISLHLLPLLESSEILSSGDVAALVYLWNPLTIISCLGLSTSPVENLFIVLSLYGAIATFGWVVATHFSLYPSILILPVILLLRYGADSPPRKYFYQTNSTTLKDNPSNDRCLQNEMTSQIAAPINLSWRPVVHFLIWTFVWSFYLLILCGISLWQHGGLWKMLKRTYGFILTMEDLSPNIGVLWYFFAEVFDFFRNFFLIVFHMNILFMIVPLAIRLNHRPCFLAFVYIAISSMLKSYPSVGDSALYLGLLGLFINELAEMKFSFFLFCGYVGVFLLSPVMHNLWIWRGTGNANFYFATAMAYACLQIILVIESVSAMLNHDRLLEKLSKTVS